MHVLIVLLHNTSHKEGGGGQQICTTDCRLAQQEPDQHKALTLGTCDNRAGVSRSHDPLISKHAEVLLPLVLLLVPGYDG
jgi:hypothetical protein